jgi:release factor glutamine methyltransferase
MQLKEVIQKTTQFFRDKGFDSPRLDTELLMSRVLGWDRVKLYLNFDYPLSDDELNRARELVKRRASGEPVAYILGSKDFYRHTFAVSPAVLIPRPETETLVEKTVEWIQAHACGDTIRIVDFGTGSGCIGLSLLAELEPAKLLAVDVSPQAIDVAQANAKTLGVSERAEFLAKPVEALADGEIESLLGGSPDVIVANPPYIAEDDPEIQANVKAFEPASALFSGDGGLAHVKAWAAIGAKALRPGGLMMFEIGYKQGSQARAVFEKQEAFECVEIVKDLAGLERFVRAIKKRSASH